MAAIEFEGDGVVWGADKVKALVISGTEGRDNIIATEGDDIIDGLAGNDIIRGGEGDDTLLGNIGNDYLYGDNGDDRLVGGEGNDILNGGNGGDVLQGGDGNDYLYGYAADDVLKGGAGNDRLTGGAGNDTYKYALGDGVDTIYSEDVGDSADILSFDEGINLEDINFSRIGEDLRITVGKGDQVTVDNFFSDGDTYGSALNAIEFFDGTVLSMEAINELVGGGSLAADSIMGTDASDYINALAGNDYINGGAGSDVISGGHGDDVVLGGEGYDRLDGGADDDQLFGEAGGDTISGGAGDDVLTGGTGNDVLKGADGSDTYVFSRGDGQDVIDNYNATATTQDIAQFTDANAEDLWFSREGNALLISTVGSEERVSVNSWFSSPYYQLDEIATADGAVSAAQVEQLVNAMAVFDVPTGAGAVLSQEQDALVQTLVAEVWQVS
ncbi:calcium-binding protein [Marinagarivorans algicola]|uniref:calcium-binding protein n=1 Tax=Marinagarivorans algicola TaxID=1513270 RepID=UPI0006B69234|nr:calcium-binding protein [Marinagarivorans algicola]